MLFKWMGGMGWIYGMGLVIIGLLRAFGANN